MSAVAAGAGALLAGRWLGRRVRRARAGLQGQVVVITGASRGLGHMLARLYAAEGARVAICARDALELDRALLNLEERGAEVLAAACDVADPEQAHRFVDDVLGRFGRIDLLVNNAGVIQVGPLEDMHLEDFRQAMDVNFWGTVHTTLAALPHMRGRGGGLIVNITSIGAKLAMPHLLPYDWAKFAALGFSEGLRAELAREGIGVTTVVPGLMRTGSVVSAVYKGDPEGEFSWFSAAARSPLLSMDVRRAAARIVAATILGEHEVVLGWQTKLARLGKDLFPNLTTRLLGLVARLLPRPGPDVEARGKEIVNARRLRAFGAPAKA